MGVMERMKTCVKCSLKKQFSLFAKDKRTSDGMRKTCADCTTLSPRAKSVCGVCGETKTLGKDCDSCSKRRKSDYKKRHAERVRQARSEYKKAKWKAGEAERKAKKANRIAERPIKIKISKKKWKQRNPHKVIANTAKRFASKLRATPAWANNKAIEQVYMMARSMSDSTGVKWHVDHVVPLRGKNVCGLHVEHNLTFLPAAFNISKSNKFADWAST
jgi:hypothetical protein